MVWPRPSSWVVSGVAIPVTDLWRVSSFSRVRVGRRVAFLFVGVVRAPLALEIYRDNVSLGNAKSLEPRQANGK
jgi:hypothetical protein